MLHTKHKQRGKTAPPRASAIIVTLPVILHHSSCDLAGLTQVRSLAESGREQQLSAACVLLHRPVSPPAPAGTIRPDTEGIPALQVSKVHDSSHQEDLQSAWFFSSMQGSVCCMSQSLPCLVTQSSSGGQSTFTLHPAVQ